MKRFIVLIAGVVIGLALFAFYEIQSSLGVLKGALEQQGISLAEVIARGGENALRAQDEIEKLAAKRLLDNARMIREFEPEEGFSEQDLVRLGDLNDLFRIHLFDAKGVRVASNFQTWGLRANPMGRTVAHLKDVLDGKKEEDIIGLKSARFEEGNRFAVVVRRKMGGAIVVNVDAYEMVNFYQSVGLRRVLDDVVKNENVVYARLEYASGSVLQTPLAESMTHVDLLHDVTDESGPVTVEHTVDGLHIFEVAMPFALAGEHIGLLRIGLSADVLQEQRTNVQWRLLFLGGLVLLLMGVVWGLRQALHEKALLEHELKRTDRLAAMGELASGVAHEVRNPLNAIGLSVQMLSRRYQPTADPAGFEELTTRIYGEVKRVNGIIQQFLTFARPSPLKMEQTPFVAFLKDALVVMRARIADKGLEFKTSFCEEIEVVLDREQMTQVVVNLLENAVAATKEGAIEVRCGLQGRWIWFSVSDTGAGIPAPQLERIFDLYFTTKDDGTGLGLSMVQRIVSDHGGHIEVESVVGQGSTFKVSIPKGT